MKNSIIILFGFLVILTTSCVSSKVLPSPNPVTKTLQLDSEKNSNFIKANEWMVSTFGNAESVIQFTDKEAGIVKGKYSMSNGQAGTNYTPAVSAYFAMITIRVKDKGARIEIDPINQFAVTNFMGGKYGFTPEQFISSADNLIKDFENKMNMESANETW